MKNSALVLPIIISTLLSSVVSAQTCSTKQKEIHPDGQYIDRADGTVLDVVNGLLWYKCNLGEHHLIESNSCSGTPNHYPTWESALKATENPDLTTMSDHADFRLPNIKELGSLVDYRCVSPAINLTKFGSTVNIPYWTSTPDATNINPAPGYEGQLIDFYDGQEVDTGMTGIIAIRLVKKIN